MKSAPFIQTTKMYLHTYIGVTYAVFSFNIAVNYAVWTRPLECCIVGSRIGNDQLDLRKDVAKQTAYVVFTYYETPQSVDYM